MNMIPRLYFFESYFFESYYFERYDPAYYFEKYEKSPETLWLKGLALRVKATQELPRAILKAPTRVFPTPRRQGRPDTQQGPALI